MARLNKINTENKNRALQQLELARSQGFAPKPPIYALGTPVVADGVKNAQIKRQEFEAYPTVTEMAETLRDQILAEDRVDMVIAPEHIAMQEDGSLQLAQDESCQILPEGLKQLVQMLPGIPPYAGPYLANIPPSRRATEFNHLVAAASTLNARRVVLRTRLNPQSVTRQVYATVSEDYVPYNPDRLCEDVLLATRMNSQLKSARGEALYDGLRTTLRIMTHSNVQPEHYVAGEFFHAVFSISTSDDRSRAIEMTNEAHRNLCLNLIVIDIAQKDILKKRHIGNMSAVAQAVEEGIITGTTRLSEWMGLWSDGRQAPITQPDAAFRVLCGVQDKKEKKEKTSLPFLSATGVDPRELADYLYNMSYQREPDPTKTGIVNAITRAAHERGWPSLKTVEDFQYWGGQLLAMTDQRFYQTIGQ